MKIIDKVLRGWHYRPALLPTFLPDPREVQPTNIREFRVRSPPNGTLLVSGVSAPVERPALTAFRPAAETLGYLVVDAPSREMGFPLHAEAMTAYFEGGAGVESAGVSPAAGR